MNDILLLRIWLDQRELEHRAFSNETVVLGRDPYADIYLEDPTVSRTHAVIKRKEKGFGLEDISTNGTIVNGKSYQQYDLADGDELSIGRFRVVVEIHPGTSPAFYLLSRGQGLGIDLERTMKDESKPAPSS